MTTAPNMRIIRGDALVAELRGADAPTPFQTAGWCRAWIAEAAAAEGAQPLLLRAETADGRPVYAGLQVHREQAGPVLRPLCWPWADYHRAWWAGGAPEPDDAVATLAAALTELQRIEDASLDLPDIATGDLLHRAALFAGATSSRASPVVSLDLTDLERVAAVLERKQTVRKVRMLARHGAVELIHWRDPSVLRDRIPAFIEMHTAQWRDRPDAVAPFDGGPVSRTFEAAAQQADSSVVLSELRLGSVPLAMYYGFLHGGRYWAYRTAFDQEYGRFSPGTQLVAGMIRDFAAQGVRDFDLMRGDYPYKADYSDEVTYNIRLQRAKP